MPNPIAEVMQAISRQARRLAALEKRIETLELQNLHERLEKVVALADLRAADHDRQLLRLAEIVADLSTQ